MPFLNEIASDSLEEFHQMLMRTEDKHDVHDGLLVHFLDEETVFCQLFDVLELVEFI